MKQTYVHEIHSRHERRLFVPWVSFVEKRWAIIKTQLTPHNNLLSLAVGAISLCCACSAHAGAQREEALSASVQAVLQRAVSDQATPKLAFSSQQEAQIWLDEMSQRLAKKIPDAAYRFDLLSTVHYEATRAGLDPHMVLGLIEVESGFRKYAVSKVGARGFMQVMPFWKKSIGKQDQNLFHMRTNLRYGCTILRHYVDLEKGDLYRALGRYNGSVGKPEYPNLVKAAWHKHWTRPASLRS
ncbi:MAG: lytic transglycosylase domain-containing protein [Sideroxydans sp.]|nr:lytic transglycosylase domain-containing protein [Sideroxydans sp.]NOT99067.1 lytic transglycosylase domain-containing protein [Sideroxydans sp.]